MYCGQCGAQIQPDQKFCNSCGTAVTTAPAAGAPARGRVSRHLQVLGILWIVFSVLRLIPGLAMLGMSGAVSMPFMPAHFEGWLRPMMHVLGIVVIGLSLAGFVAGWALLERVSWARTLALVIGIISLIHIPFGTAIGIYTLWVLLPAQSEEEFHRISSPA